MTSVNARTGITDERYDTMQGKRFKYASQSPPGLIKAQNYSIIGSHPYVLTATYDLQTEMLGFSRKKSQFG